MSSSESESSAPPALPSCATSAVEEDEAAVEASEVEEEDEGVLLITAGIGTVGLAFAGLDILFSLAERVSGQYDVFLYVARAALSSACMSAKMESMEDIVKGRLSGKKIELEFRKNLIFKSIIL